MRKKTTTLFFDGFVGIESFCIRCQDVLLFKSLSNKHLKTFKIPDLTRLALAAFEQLPVSVMESNSLVIDLGTGFRFRDWSYSSISIRLK